MVKTRQSDPCASFLRLDQLPLFADDADLARAIVGPNAEKVQHWLAFLPSLESQGLPRRHPVYGRYVPAVRQFYDRWYGLIHSENAGGERALERPWSSPKSRRPQKVEVDRKVEVEETDDEILSKLGRSTPPRGKRRRLF